MKIKLSNLKLIDITYIDKRIEELNIVKENHLDSNAMPYYHRISAVIIELGQLKSQLIDSEKLAELAFDKGCLTNYQGENIKKYKQEFLNSEIRL